MISQTLLDTELLKKLRHITEQSAIACSHWIGRGDKIEADNAAVKCMRTLIDELNLNAQVLIGEGEKDEAPLLFKGERFGSQEVEWDIVVDPLEGTTNLAKGLNNAMSVMALCETGKVFDPGDSFYMDKIAGSAAIKGKINPHNTVEEILKITAESLAKPIDELNVFVLDKPRHKDLILRIYATGAKVSHHSAGDVAGAILAALPNSDIDLLLGVGGTPEGLLSACAIKSIGGEFIGRLAPQLSSEIIALKQQGYSTEYWHTIDELIKSDNIYFCATGITDGDLFSGIKQIKGYLCCESLILHGRNNDLLTIKAFKKSTIN